MYPGAVVGVLAPAVVVGAVALAASAYVDVAVDDDATGIVVVADGVDGAPAAVHLVEFVVSAVVVGSGPAVELGSDSVVEAAVAAGPASTTAVQFGQCVKVLILKFVSPVYAVLLLDTNAMV